MRTVTGTGSVRNAGKVRAAEDEMSIPLPVGLFLEAYSSKLVALESS
ncbi:hypothetical protein [Streptomyces sp. NPDC046374]